MATPVGAKTFYGDLKLCAKTKTYSGWETHNRGDRGDGWGPVHGILVHDTVTKSTQGAVDMCRAGITQANGDVLPGPLYQIVVDKQGVCHLIGWGRANHAGTGDPAVLERVIKEQLPYPKPRFANGQKGGVDGNARFYGIAMLNMGDGKDPFPAAQVDAAATAAAVLCHLHNWTDLSVIGHKDWQLGKVDPTGLSMTDFRARVKARRKVVDGALRSR